jgi:hypothetical protein
MAHFHASEITRADHGKTEVLRAWFRDSGGPFHFLNVPAAVFEGLCGSLERDAFFAEFIRSKFDIRP